MHIFPGPRFRLLCQGTIVHCFLFMISTLITEILACIPVEEAWSRWKGESTALCYDNTTFWWAHSVRELDHSITRFIGFRYQLTDPRQSTSPRICGSSAFPFQCYLDSSSRQGKRSTWFSCSASVLCKCNTPSIPAIDLSQFDSITVISIIRFSGLLKYSTTSNLTCKADPHPGRYILGSRAEAKPMCTRQQRDGSNIQCHRM